jgi:AraC-like DNA-binding protein
MPSASEGVVAVSNKSILHKYPAITTGDADELSVALTPFFGRVVVEPERRAEPFHLQLNICRLPRLALSFSASAEAFHIDASDNSFFLHGFPVCGRAEHRNNGAAVLDTPNKGAAGEPGSLKLSYGPNVQLFATFLERASIVDLLSGLIGAPASRELKLNRSNSDAPEAPLIRGLVALLIAELDRDDYEVSPLLLAEMQQAIIVAYLSGVPHNYSHQLNGPSKMPARWQVKRAEEYIEAHWREPMSIEALAIATNTSVRSLFIAFKKSRGYSPMAFIKRTRLAHAKRMLANSGSTTSVTEACFECGFGNMGHFASDYKKLFGEAPSETLQMARLGKFVQLNAQAHPPANSGTAPT